MCTQELVRFIVLLDLPNGMWQNEGEARHLFRQFDFKMHQRGPPMPLRRVLISNYYGSKNSDIEVTLKQSDLVENTINIF